MKVDGGRLALAGLILFAALLSALIWWLFAQGSSAGSSGESPLGADSVAVAAMDVHEDCRPLDRGESLHYSFEATRPLDFDIHFHDAGLVYTPVEIKAVKTHQGSFQAETKQDYCFMWTSQSLKDTWLAFQVEGP